MGSAAPDGSNQSVQQLRMQLNAQTNKQTLSAQVPSLDVDDLCTLAMVMMCNAHPVGDHYDALYEHGSAINHSCRVGLLRPSASRAASPPAGPTALCSARSRSLRFCHRTA